MRSARMRPASRSRGPPRYAGVAGPGRARIDTTEDLAAVEVQDEALWTDYLPEVTHQGKARARLATAVRRARMMLAGEVLQRTTSGPIDIPAADVEVGVDVCGCAQALNFVWKMCAV